MKKRGTKLYDLLMEKPFSELASDEKELVLDELGSKEAYEQMREMVGVAEEDEIPSPPPAEMKSNVMGAFDQEHGRKRGGMVWWKYAAVIAVLIAGTWILWPSQNEGEAQLAENKPKTNDQETVEENADDASEKKLAEEVLSEEEETSTSPAPPEKKDVKDDEMEFAQVQDEEADRVREETKSSELPIAEDEPAIAEVDDEEIDYVADEAANVSEEVRLNQRKTNVSSLSARESSGQSYSAVNAGLTLRSLGGPFKDAYVAY